MAEQSVARQVDLAEVGSVDSDDEPQAPTPLYVGDEEIIRRVRVAHPEWREVAPTQELVKAVALTVDRESGDRQPTCGVDRTRRLRELAQLAELDDAESAATSSDVPQIGASAEHLGARAPRSWPLLVLALPAFVAVWSGWVGLGRLTGFGRVNLLPGLVADSGWSTIDTAITLPIGMEAYAAYALWVWLSRAGSQRARSFARWSAVVSLVVGALGQVAYHLMSAAGLHAAPWQITTVVSCLPVAVLGMGAALSHLVRADRAAA